VFFELIPADAYWLLRRKSCFLVHGPTIWNGLPCYLQLRDISDHLLDWLSKIPPNTLQVISGTSFTDQITQTTVSKH